MSPPLFNINITCSIRCIIFKKRGKASCPWNLFYYNINCDKDLRGKEEISNLTIERLFQVTLQVLPKGSRILGINWDLKVYSCQTTCFILSREILHKLVSFTKQDHICSCKIYSSPHLTFLPSRASTDQWTVNMSSNLQP